MEGGQIGEVMVNAVNHVDQEQKSNEEHVPIHAQAMKEVSASGDFLPLYPAT